MLAMLALLLPYASGKALRLHRRDDALLSEAMVALVEARLAESASGR